MASLNGPDYILFPRSRVLTRNCYWKSRSKIHLVRSLVAKHTEQIQASAQYIRIDAHTQIPHRTIKSRHMSIFNGKFIEICHFSHWISMAKISKMFNSHSRLPNSRQNGFFCLMSTISVEFLSVQYLKRCLRVTRPAICQWYMCAFQWYLSQMLSVNWCSYFNRATAKRVDDSGLITSKMQYCS